MLANENLWIKATHGYFQNEDPALHGVTESRVDLAKFPYDISGRNSGIRFYERSHRSEYSGTGARQLSLYDE